MQKQDAWTRIKGTISVLNDWDRKVGSSPEDVQGTDCENPDKAPGETLRYLHINTLHLVCLESNLCTLKPSLGSSECHRVYKGNCVTRVTHY